LDIDKLDFCLFIVVGNRGSGKTLFATNYAKAYSSLYPGRKIYSNYKIKLKNNIYDPFMFLSYSKIDKSLIIIDDIKAIKNFHNFIFVITNWSRKAKLHIILTGQYYTHFKKETRTLAEFEVRPYYVPESDMLYLAFVDLDGKVYHQVIKDAVKNVRHLYDTKEKVPLATDSIMLDLIKKASKNKLDLEINLSLYFNRAQTNSYLKKLCKELGY